jgi:hypothetical protein
LSWCSSLRIDVSNSYNALAYESIDNRYKK